MTEQANLAQPVDVLRVMRSDALAAEEYRFTAAGDSIAALGGAK